MPTPPNRPHPLFARRVLRTSSSFLILMMGLLLAAQAAEDDTSKGDLARLQGTWLTVSLVSNGKTLMDEKSPPKPGPVTKLVYEGDHWRVKVGDETVASGILKIDATRTPKEIDILDGSGMNNDKTKLAIYELKGDTYKYCIAPSGKPRPTEFSSQEGSGNSLIVSKREKP